VVDAFQIRAVQHPRAAELPFQRPPVQFFVTSPLIHHVNRPKIAVPVPKTAGTKTGTLKPSVFNTLQDLFPISRCSRSNIYIPKICKHTAGKNFLAENHVTLRKTGTKVISLYPVWSKGVPLSGNKTGTKWQKREQKLLISI